MNIAEYAAKHWSQFGEDGALLELVRRLDPPHSFVEIGCGDGSENCTRVLAERLKWTGVWIDADPGNTVKAIPTGNPLGIRTYCAHVTTETSGHIAGMAAREFGVLSIDVDGNDHHLWRAFCGGPYSWRPYIVVIEAQIQKPYDEPYEMPYAPFYIWDHKSYDSGASVFSMRALGDQLGYHYVGKLDDQHSPNLFFVRKDLVGRLDDAASQ